MTSAELGDIDLGFRPTSYFWPMGLETHLLARIKGAKREAALKGLIDSGRLEDIPDFLAQSALSADERKALGRLHPAFMGGEHLPDLMPNEVMVARITIASVTQDVVCVYARRTRHRIVYRVVDEYRGDTLSSRKTQISPSPLTLGQLESFLNGAWSIFGVLDKNFGESGYDPDEMQHFVSFESEFYAQFEQLYRRRISVWAASHHEEDNGGAVPTNDAELP